MTMARRKETVSNQMIMRAVVSLSDRVDGLATKSELEKVKEDILEELRPIGKAVDKDAVTIVNHERRIARIEERLSAKR